MNKPIYTVCICNYNMNTTLKISLETVLKQLDKNFEVLVVDDGSTDKSVETLVELKKTYPILRFISLQRDKRRKLGETRNVSIRAARGEYVILHIDCDDLWDPFIKSFTKVYHELEKRLNLHDFMLSGQQIQMSKRNLILENPYKNIAYGEDRLLWNDLHVIGRLKYLNHKIFRTRIPIVDKKRRLTKTIKNQFNLMVVSFQYGKSPFIELRNYIKEIICRRSFSLKRSILILLLLFPSFIFGTIKYLRNKPVPSIKKGYEYLETVNLLLLEKDTKEKYGLFPLNGFEREIFHL